ncbi:MULTISPECIES: xylose operon transcription regulator XylR [Proteiniphilum]|jgi:LacI family transcriptional regulator|uniref:AraC family transcriptional regulator n=1 Tax=Proteiniphilum TaxID=294702 RepID=UPI001EEB63CF|nr:MULTISPECIES: DNA-binding transcriptional regulator [Proteiniphilum]ULB35589.1 DNA-binding transcriptional regulator [Proteiniphilum propionicum]
MNKILILIDYSSEFSRRLLKGLIQYSKEHGPWIFYRLPAYYKTLYGEEGIVEWAKEWEADAIIARWDQEGANLLATLNIPILLQNYKERSPYFSNLTGDYIGTGQMAAKFFIKRRYRNFAFYGNKGVVWSRERAEGFWKEVEKAGGNYYYFESENLNGEQWSKSHIQLDEWLLSLPKPVGLFACDDSFALQVSEICKINNIKIPEDISLLGVDNDELICNLSDPPISSIMTDVEKGGYEAGRLIDRFIKREITEPFDIIIRPTRFELRKSTEKYDISNEYISEIVNFIEDNFTTDINIDSFSEMVPLSRRNLEVKFKDEMGISIYQFILSCRIDYFAHLLLTTDRTLFDLALESGFNDCKNISRIFKKMKGCTPIEYRKKYSDHDNE